MQTGNVTSGSAAEAGTAEAVALSIFELRTAYHNSLSNMRGWLGDTRVSGRLTTLDRLSILDAWRQEMLEFFEHHGYCFKCSRRLDRCRCESTAAD